MTYYILDTKTGEPVRENLSLAEAERFEMLFNLFRHASEYYGPDRYTIEVTP